MVKFTIRKDNINKIILILLECSARCHDSWSEKKNCSFLFSPKDLSNRPSESLSGNHSNEHKTLICILKVTKRAQARSQSFPLHLMLSCSRYNSSLQVSSMTNNDFTCQSFLTWCLFYMHVLFIRAKISTSIRICHSKCFLKLKTRIVA